MHNRIKTTEIHDGGELMTHIAHLVGSSIVFKTGNVNRFTVEQWEYTVAIMAKALLNWLHILFKTLVEQIAKYTACKKAGKTKFRTHCRLLTRIFLTYPQLVKFLNEN